MDQSHLVGQTNGYIIRDPVDGSWNEYDVYYAVDARVSDIKESFTSIVTPVTKTGLTVALSSEWRFILTIIYQESLYQEKCPYIETVRMPASCIKWMNAYKIK